MSQNGVVTDQIRCDIHGTSIDDVLERLQTLTRLVRHIELFVVQPGTSTPPIFRFQPPDAANTNYCVAFSATVAEPNLSRLIRSQYIIHDVVVTITREAQWRLYQIVTGAESFASWQSVILAPSATTSVGNVGPWGKMRLGINPPPEGFLGSLPVPVHIEYGPRFSADGLEADTFYFAYKPDVAGFSDVGGLYELSANSLGTSIADSNAEGGTTIQANFATNATHQARAAATINFPTDKWKVLLRASAASGTVARSLITWFVDNTGQVITNQPVDITAGALTHYKWWDMGNIRMPIQAVGNQSFQNTVTVTLYSQRTVGSGEAYFDALFLLPIDEAYVRMQLNTTLSSSLVSHVIYTSVNPNYIGGLLSTGTAGDTNFRKIYPNGVFAGQMIMRGYAGTLYWLTNWTNSTFGVPKDSGTDRWRLHLGYIPVYSSPRGLV